MDATVNQTDCSCATTDIPEGSGCSLRVAYCAYMLPENTSNFQKNPIMRYRARVWDLSNPEYSGASAGYRDMNAGAMTPEDAQVDAANNLRQNFPARSCGDVEPLVMVPGFMSSEIQCVVCLVECLQTLASMRERERESVCVCVVCVCVCVCVCARAHVRVPCSQQLWLAY